MDRTCSGTGYIDLTGVQYQFDRFDFFSTLLKFCFLRSLLESHWVLSTLVLSRTPCFILLHSTATYTQEGSKTLKNRLHLRID
jgi:hypothetical protein